MREAKKLENKPKTRKITMSKERLLLLAVTRPRKRRNDEARSKSWLSPLQLHFISRQRASFSEEPARENNAE